MDSSSHVQNSPKAWRTVDVGEDQSCALAPLNHVDIQLQPLWFMQVPKSEALEATKYAIEVGFRHIDSAYLYQNEEQVGQAIRSKIADGTVKREDIFYTSKVGCVFQVCAHV